MSEVSIIGLDIAKHVFHAHGADERGHALFSKRISRGRLAISHPHLNRMARATRSQNAYWFAERLLVSETSGHPQLLNSVCISDF